MYAVGKTLHRVWLSQKAALGIQAQRWLAKGGSSEKDLADIVAERWSAAAQYGGVAIQELPDAAAVRSSADVATPLTELMLARPVDGAITVLIARDDIARRVSRSPVFITGMGTSMDRHAFASRDGTKLASAEAAAKMAYKRAGWGGAEADVAEISGASVVGEAMAIHALGLHGSKATINRSGGALPADPIMATGLVRLAHAAKQLCSPELYDLKGPSRAIVHGAGGIAMQNNCVFTLEV